MAFITVLNRNNYPAGIHTYGPYPIDANVSYVLARLARFEKLGNGKRKNGSEWADVRDAQNVQQNVAKYSIEISLDGGLNWQSVGGGTAAGGVLENTPGVEEEYSGIGLSLPGAGNPNRQVRGTLQTFEALGTIVEVEFS